MKRTLRTMGLVLFGALVIGAGCYGYDYAVTPARPVAPVVSVAVAPPPPATEIPPRQPYPGAVWMAGYWDWRADLGRHVWVAGHWATPPRAGVVWMPPQWRMSPSGSYYRVPGRWVAGTATDRFGRHLAYDSMGRPYYF
jgi:hypothetical protein